MNEKLVAPNISYVVGHSGDVKTKKVLQIIRGATFLVSIALSNQALAENPTNCAVNTSVTQKNEYRTAGGFTPVNGPITEGFTGLSCGNFDTFVWGAHNNDTGKMNEVDIGLGYSFTKGNFNGRIGLERRIYTENGGKNDVLVGKIGYNGLPINLGVEVTKVIDEVGTQITGTISKSFDLGNIKGIPVTLAPSVKATYLDNFFGVSGHSNNVYGLSLNGSKDKANFGVFINQHDGKKNFDDSTQVGITFSHSF
jgi:hypothetical protein